MLRGTRTWVALEQRPDLGWSKGGGKEVHSVSHVIDMMELANGSLPNEIKGASKPSTHTHMYLHQLHSPGQSPRMLLCSNGEFKCQLTSPVTLGLATLQLCLLEQCNYIYIYNSDDCSHVPAPHAAWNELRPTCKRVSQTAPMTSYACTLNPVSTV